MQAHDKLRSWTQSLPFQQELDPHPKNHPKANKKTTKPTYAFYNEAPTNSTWKSD